MIKTILYDIDGTIGNTNQLIYDSFVHTFNHFHIPYTDKEIYQAFGPTLHHTFSKYSDDEKTINEMIRVYRDFNISNHDDYVKPFPGVLETIKALDEMGVIQGVVSSKKTDLVYRGLEVINLLPYMKVVIGGDDVTKHKPDPEGILTALGKLGVDNCLLVGDNASDILSAKNASCLSCGVSWSVKPLELRESKPDFWIENINELIRIVGDN